MSTINKLSLDGNTYNIENISTYQHTKSGTIHNLEGEGFCGKVKFTDNVNIGDTWTVNGELVSAFMGSKSASESMDGMEWNGKWIIFIFDGEQINFNGGASGAADKFGHIVFASSLQGMNFNTYRPFDSQYFYRGICQKTCTIRFFTSVAWNVSWEDFIFGVSVNGDVKLSALSSTIGADNLVYDLGTLDLKVGDSVEAYMPAATSNQRGGSIIGVLDSGEIISFSQDFSYTGEKTSIVIPYDGTYEIEVAGAKGGQGGARYQDGRGPDGANGGYAKGKFWFKKGTELNIWIGGIGSRGGDGYKNGTAGVGGAGGFGYGSGSNGANASSGSVNGGGGGGGGGSKISTTDDSIFIEASGGAGSQGNRGGNGGSGGGITGGTCTPGQYGNAGTPGYGTIQGGTTLELTKGKNTGNGYGKIKFLTPY